MIKSQLRIWLWMNFYLILRIITGTFFVMLTILAAAYLTFTTGPYLEYKLFPVAEEWNVESAKVNPKSIDFKGVYHKIRDCRAMKVNAYLTHPGDSDTFDSTKLTTNLDPTTTRPLGWNTTTDWVVSTEHAGPGSEFFFVVDYHCHPFWDTKLITPKFSVPFNGEPVKMGDYVDMNQR